MTLVTLVAILCRLGSPGACVEEIVTDSSISPITLQGCEIQGQIGIAGWMSRHPVYHVDWRLERYKCVLGPYVPRVPA